MRSRRCMNRFLLAFFLLALGAPVLAGVRPVGLSCEHLVNPLGIDSARPRLTWRLEGDRRGERQTAYRLLVAPTDANLRGEKGDLWDSGKATGDEPVQIPYGGAARRSAQRCVWKVRAE